MIYRKYNLNTVESEELRDRILLNSYWYMLVSDE